MPSVLLRLTRLIGVLAILTILCTPVSGLCAANGVVFGPRDVTVGSWGVHVSAHRFECTAGGGGSLVVSRRTADTSFWGGFVLVNKSFFSLHEFLESSQPVFVADLNLGKTNVIGVTLIGEPGATLGIEVRANGSVNLPQATFSASPETITLGQASTLQWTSTDAAEPQHRTGYWQLWRRPVHRASPRRRPRLTLSRRPVPAGPSPARPPSPSSPRRPR